MNFGLRFIITSNNEKGFGNALIFPAKNALGHLIPFSYAINMVSEF